jgi:hypothetical protein
VPIVAAIAASGARTPTVIRATAAALRVASDAWDRIVALSADEASAGDQ